MERAPTKHCWRSNPDFLTYMEPGTRQQWTDKNMEAPIGQREEVPRREAHGNVRRDSNSSGETGVEAHTGGIQGGGAPPPPLPTAPPSARKGGLINPYPHGDPIPIASILSLPR